MTILSRVFVCLAVLFSAASALAGTLTVKSPTEGTFLGLNNQLKFLVTGATVDVTVRAVVSGRGTTSTVEQTFTPNDEGKIDAQLPINFNSSSPEGDYLIVVTAAEPGNTYASTTLNVKVDVVRPSFLEFTPNVGAFVKGVVPIRATLKETNIKSWEVKINGQSIPNNTGDSNTVFVDWNTSTVSQDGAQTITITAKDRAGNEASKTVTVTLDRIKPTVTIAYPRSDTRLPPMSAYPVLVDIIDATSRSVDVTGVDVVMKRMDGSFLGRAARVSYVASGANGNRWTGRIRDSRTLPRQFRLVVTAIDRAGNSAVPQEVVVTLSR